MNEFFFFHFCSARLPVNVRIACASTLPLDPQGVGLSEGDVAPEDLFNPILYKACSNFGMSQIEARIYANSQVTTPNVGQDVVGQSANVDVDTLTDTADEFPVYYGLLANSHGWRHANPQQGLEMNGLKPLVYEILYNVGDQIAQQYGPGTGQALKYPVADGSAATTYGASIRGNAKPLPFINCTSYTGASGSQNPGFAVGPDSDHRVTNVEQDVPWINCVVGAIIVPPSRLHELFYRMVIEWTIEFSQIRPIGEITNWAGLGIVADLTHYQNYSFEATKKVLGVDGELMDHDQTMVSANVEINKVM